jgi:hypothetical protein
VVIIINKITVYIASKKIFFKIHNEDTDNNNSIGSNNELIFDKGLELADAMKEHFNVEGIKHQNGAVGYFTSDLVKRKEIFIHITKLLYGQYLYNQKRR